jgi:aminocarboxymuconate-semialdehyde decarboxylase
LLQTLKKRPIDYFKMFIGDTATFGSDSATRCGLDFFGVENTVFASDAPFDPEKGPGYIRETIRVIDGLDISAGDRDRIYRRNAEKLLKISVG